MSSDELERLAAEGRAKKAAAEAQRLSTQSQEERERRREYQLVTLLPK